VEPPTPVTPPASFTLQRAALALAAGYPQLTPDGGQAAAFLIRAGLLVVWPQLNVSATSG
jgi:hypothetical protein